MLLLRLLRGVATYIPRLGREAVECDEGTVSARYCYTVWMRHMVLAAELGLPSQPAVVAELGPGDSVGTGLAALLSGVGLYYALDVVRYAKMETNRKVLEELINLYDARAPIPDEAEFPKVEPRLKSYAFPHHILTPERLRDSLHGPRLDAIRRAVVSSEDVPADDLCIRYFAPWSDSTIIQPESVDMIYGQAVLEHVDDLAHVYRVLHSWLKPGGFMSQVIDFKCHGTADQWNGHWTYPNWAWRLIRGKRTYLINRQPHSVHSGLIRALQFEVVRDAPCRRASEITRDKLAAPFLGMSDDDLETASAHIVAVKKS